jgi:hypothetical protein
MGDEGRRHNGGRPAHRRGVEFERDHVGLKKKTEGKNARGWAEDSLPQRARA